MIPGFLTRETEKKKVVINWVREACRRNKFQEEDRNSFWSCLVYIHRHPNENMTQSCPGWCGSVDWVPACEPKGHRFNFQTGHRPGLWASSPVGHM